MSDSNERRALSKAQVKHLSELRNEAQQAQAAFMRYVEYLTEEHEIEKDGKWRLGVDAFEKQAANGQQPDKMPMLEGEPGAN